MTLNFDFIHWLLLAALVAWAFGSWAKGRFGRGGKEEGR